MLDQAAMLRRKMNQTRVVSVISGKGGVGKSNVSLNFALALRKLGKKVILFDLDIGMANLDILMGMLPTHTIVDMIEKKLSVWDIIEKGTGGLPFIAGGSGLSEFFRLDEHQSAHFLNELEKLGHEFDTIIFDMGAGMTEDALKFVLASNEAIIVTTPEPTSMTDAYAALKMIYHSGGEIPVRILVNRAQTDHEGRETSLRLQQVTEKFLQRKIRTFCILPEDRIVSDAVKAGVPFLFYSPRSPVARAVMEAAQIWSGLPTEQGGFFHRLKKYFYEYKEKTL
ncbi:MAG TPA: MinD/ParA family protein [Bacillales bacterium]|nr:MinD/ParA family protein [Bacillales bacterium]